MATLSPDPRKRFPTPPYPSPPQDPPGRDEQMDPKPDYGEESYVGHDRLSGKVAIITGADSGIGRAVALAYAREGADVVISYLSEHEDAQETARLVGLTGKEALAIPGDIQEESHCRSIIEKAVSKFGKVDILVNNAAFQRTHESIEEMPSDEFETTFRTNIFAMFYLVKAAVPHMVPGSAIINTTSIQADSPGPELLGYAATKAAIQNFTGGLAKLFGKKGIRANCVAPGPIWTPLIPSTLPPDSVKTFGSDVPLGRAAQPIELAPVYVMLATEEASYVSGATVAVTGGSPLL